MLTNGERLRALRERQALSMEQLARKADLSTATVWRAEQGLSVARGTVRKLAHTLRVSVQELQAEPGVNPVDRSEEREVSRA